jgi:hypothetical protein
MDMEADVEDMSTTVDQSIEELYCAFEHGVITYERYVELVRELKFDAWPSQENKQLALTF